jgi:hypothetical protein
MALGMYLTNFKVSNASAPEPTECSILFQIRFEALCVFELVPVCCTLGKAVSGRRRYRKNNPRYLMQDLRSLAINPFTKFKTLQNLSTVINFTSTNFRKSAQCYLFKLQLQENFYL